MVSPIGPVGSSSSGVPGGRLGRGCRFSGALIVTTGAAEVVVSALILESAAGGAVREVSPAGCFLPAAYAAAYAAD